MVAIAEIPVDTQHYIMQRSTDSCKFYKKIESYEQTYSRLRCLLRVKGLVICFYLGWSGSILQIRTNRLKVGSKSWLLACSSNIILSLPSYTAQLSFEERAKCLLRLS